MAHFQRAQEAGTIKAYRAFLREQPRGGQGFEAQRETARAELIDLELQEALSQDMLQQIKFVCSSKHKESRDRVFEVVRGRLEGKSRVECMQWLWPLGKCAEGLPASDRSYLSEILGLKSYERTLWDKQDWAHTHPFDKCLGPYGVSVLSDFDLTKLLNRIRISSERWFHNEFLWGSLLYASTRRTSLKWAHINSPFADGTPTSPRIEGIRVLKKVISPTRVAECAGETDSLAGERAWSLLQELIETRWFRSDMERAFHLLVEIDRPEVLAELLPTALINYRSEQVPCLLRCLSLDVPGMQEHLPTWMQSEDWKEQAVAALVIARYRIRTVATLEHLRRWEVGNQRGLRGAARRALEALGETVATVQAEDTLGLASAERHFAAIDRGFLAHEEAAHLVGLSQLPSAPLDRDTVFEKLKFPRSAPDGTWIRQAHLRFAFKANCWALEFASKPQEYLLDPVLNPTEEGLRIPTLAVLIRDQPLIPDPDDDQAFLLYPQVSFCCQDSESGQILVGYEDYSGMKFRPAVTDVAQAAKAILSRQGLKAPYKNHRAGVVLIISESLLESGDKEIDRQVELAWFTFLQCVNSYYGEELFASYRSARWKLPPLDPGFTRGKPFARQLKPELPKASAELLRAHAFIPGATKNRYTLSLSPAPGQVTNIRDEQGRLLIDIKTKSGEIITIPELLVTCVIEGSEMTQGQVLGLRFR